MKFSSFIYFFINFFLKKNSLWANYSMLTCKGAYEWDQNRINHYKLYLRNNPEDPTDVLIYLWCFSPSLSFQDIMSSSVRSLILTSGTLAPFKSFESETKIEYPIILANNVKNFKYFTIFLKIKPHFKNFVNEYFKKITY